MKAFWLSFSQGIPLMLLSLVLLAFVTYMGYQANWNSTETFSALMALVGVAGVTSIAVLLTTTPNGTLYIHLVFSLGLLVSMAVLSQRVINGVHVFGSAQTLPLFALFVTGAAAGAGINSKLSGSVAVVAQPSAIAVQSSGVAPAPGTPMSTGA